LSAFQEEHHIVNIIVNWCGLPLFAEHDDSIFWVKAKLSMAEYRLHVLGLFSCFRQVVCWKHYVWHLSVCPSVC